MNDISVIILTYNEQLHIRRCLDRLLHLYDPSRQTSSTRSKLPDNRVFVVDCFSADKTVEIAQEFGATVVQHPWPRLYAPQFNWALENLPITSKWVLRLDADEYLTDELIHEIHVRLEKVDQSVTGIIFKRRHIFLDRWMKRGTYPVKLLRLFQFRKAICEQRLMDEHIQLLEGDSIEFEHDFVDHNLNNLTWWSLKHVGYAVREAADLLNIEYGSEQKNESQSPITNRNCVGGSRQRLSDASQLGEQAVSKRRTKEKYARLPLFWRAGAYFCYRYFFRYGFLEGVEGFLWHFLQGFWYRCLVDAKVWEIKTKAKRELERPSSHCLDAGTVEKDNGNKAEEKAVAKAQMRVVITRVLKDEYGIGI
jgi:glycosyltransferase involved in cell wall biosynthesis